eukprot:13884020-Alexandrium_andersonii.AAC.1
MYCSLSEVTAATIRLLMYRPVIASPPGAKSVNEPDASCAWRAVVLARLPRLRRTTLGRCPGCPPRVDKGTKK